MILRLFNYAEDHWSYIRADYPGVNLINIPIYEFCDYVWAWVAKRIDPKQFEMWQMEMLAPLPGMEKSISQTTAEDEGASFMAVMALQKS